MYAILASAALLATSAAALSVGNAVVVNACEYEVYLADVPAQGGGYEEEDKMLQPGDQWTQTWTELSNDQGWSIKLGKDTTLANIMQYEYTFHNDGIIWYDLSDVNGNPWDGDWEITAESSSSTCTPKQQAYRYATDDAYGMQACPQDSVITVTLCSGESQNNGTAASVSSSVAALTSSLATATTVSTFTTPTSAVPTETPSSTEAATTTEAPSSTEAATTTEASSSTEVATSTEAATSTTSAYSGHHSHSWYNKQVEASSTPSPTTFATLTTSTISAVTTEAAGVTVTDVDTAVVTEVVTAYAKRHAHHRRHGHA